ncbi:unnamed protein product [Phytophthora fragariaefolia]|uniref:Unnamed protein product n=1 Tax=Phytophthora fragariaefolia TaxID=1490495 RepID=A0A9W6YAX0_9STRA|nr:unnamed protein product [Phytophthora fragariaefolia]
MLSEATCPDTATVVYEPDQNPKDEPTSLSELSYLERRRSLDDYSLNDLAPNGWFHPGRTDTPERTHPVYKIQVNIDRPSRPTKKKPGWAYLR